MAETDSDIVTMLGPALQGVYIHDPNDPVDTLHNFLYNSSLTVENIAVATNQLVFAGRAYPVAEFSENNTQTVDLSLTIPWSDTWQEECDIVRAYATFRGTLTFRDGRGRLLYGIVQSVRLTDRKEGTIVTFNVQRVDYSPQPQDLTVLFAAEDA
jgi:hypothetical protein